MQKLLYLCWRVKTNAYKEITGNLIFTLKQARKSSLD